jgi:chromosome partitioning protein
MEVFMPHYVAFGTLKGGTGKTLCTFNIAGELALKNKVLLLDADPQCNLTNNTGVDSSDYQRPSVLSIFEDSQTRPEDVIIAAPIAGLKQLDIIPSSILLTDTEYNLAARANRESLLYNWLTKNADALGAYDYVLMDTSPSMGLVNVNAFRAADSIILVCDVGFNSVQGAYLFTYLWEKRRRDLLLEDNVRALIINNVDRRIRLSGDLEEYLADDKELAALLVKPAIPSRVAFKHTEGEFSPITLSAPASDAARAIKALVKSLKKKGAL